MDSTLFQYGSVREGMLCRRHDGSDVEKLRILYQGLQVDFLPGGVVAVEKDSSQMRGGIRQRFGAGKSVGAASAFQPIYAKDHVQTKRIVDADQVRSGTINRWRNSCL